MTLTYHTRGNDAPKGKHYLFVHAAAEDKAAQERLVKMVLDTKDGKNYAVWCSDDPVAVFGELSSGDLGAMSVFIVLVSPEYLQLCERHAPADSLGGTFIDLRARQGVAVLPVFTSATTIAPFNRVFGDLHGINLTLPEAPRLLEEQLRSFLPDDDLRELILSEAFDGRLFLSYRKKDKEHIQRIMAVIHDTDAAGSASIWFDEFLVAGREFNDEIRSKLTESDAMVLVVTPSL
ncbi:MAG: toll/interleukin-1 receptor domain-containing protein, partial [Atopobiaceae bacterium]|nr:toll/interleukin-1 receptor domain-containing protein [Atopobiaceae bacterium]